MSPLLATLSTCRHGWPLVCLDLSGPGAELRPTDLRELATALLQVTQSETQHKARDMASVAAAPGVDSGGIPAALDPARVAEMLGCTESTVEELLRRGDLPGVKFGRGWCIPGAALIERLNDLATEQAAERRQSLAQPLSRPSARARQDQATGAEAAARAPRSRRRREPPSLTDESAP